MAIPVLNTATYSYVGQSNSFTFNFPAGSSNTCLVVTVTGRGFQAVPTTRGITYNGVSMTAYGMGWPGSLFTQVYYLIAPATGNNTLAINYSNGSNGSMDISVYALANVSQTLPMSQLSVNYNTTAYSSAFPGTGYDIMTSSGNSIPGLLIDVFTVYVNTAAWAGTPYSGQTANGAFSSYKYSTTSGDSMRWDYQSAYYPGICHQLVSVTEQKSLSFTDTVLIGDNESSTKGLLISVADGILMSESFNWVKHIFLSVSDSLGLQDRGWFGTVNLFTNVSKSVTTWLNKNKS